ncbi:hypothetical protein PEC302107_26360 [Pectobacterium araliae]|uniref:Teneurin-like YD-shell domain-containing protein n=1 Tax=Pectobacterium araliae TaxID=3073862 RepID=A0AAN0MJL1_9GAMM|nr:hypothetical protein PEC302110_04670 [Pectobacterium sp. MAFF 302110]GKW20907.1 hypothetical protein PEC302107_26360 [Pectobacterium carotovorum subsp. carotovorum]
MELTLTHDVARHRSANTEEQYRYTRSGLPQDATRLTDWQAGRLTQQDSTHYQYDKAGRLIRKQVVQPGYRPQVWHYRWDSRNQLRVVDTPTGERWYYRYDPFGRRIGKRCEQTQDELRYLWDGDQIAEVRHYRDNQLISRRHWVHNGWELLVQQRQNTDGSWETDFVTSGHNGEPQAIFNPEGELRWQAPRANLWGQRYTDNIESLDPGLAFAGQYRDAESGLCYNRFRYYDPTGGCYVSPDPISVLGGDNNYGYVYNPMGWVDPFGLAACGAGSGGKGLGGHQAVDRAAGELNAATQRAARLLDRGGHMNTAWGKIHQKWANNTHVPQWLKNVSRGNAIQQMTDKLTVDNRYLKDIVRNRTGEWWGSLRPDYHLELPGGKVAVFDITTPGQAPKISKYNVKGVTDWLINILY